jgi:hypothetical protein
MARKQKGKRMNKAQAVERLNDAIGAHGAWKLKLRVAMSTGASEINPDKACRDDKCPFGRWIHGDEIDAMTKQGKPYQVVRRLHANCSNLLGIGPNPDQLALGIGALFLIAVPHA